MNSSGKLRRKMVILVAFIVAASFQGFAQIVGFTMGSSGAATSGIAANFPGMGVTMGTSGITSSGYSVNNGQTAYGWNSVGTDAWVTSAFSTAGYISLTGSFQMKANTDIGPRDFKVQYSLNGTTWSDVASGATVTLNSSLTTYSFTFPAICENKETLYVRWVLNSLTSLNGGALAATSTYNASLKGVTIAGDPFAAPSTQASNISIISVTPTTIKIGATNGNGNNRIIVINTENSFTTPVDDYYPLANTTYNGTGEQVIYNGTGSSVTVTVPSSSNVFWFRVYDFNKMDNLTRFKVQVAESNPKKSQLETIHSPTSAAVRLTRANLGATITTPTTGTIVERGIFWSTTSPVDETSNLSSEGSNQGGVYVINNIEVQRGTTIYYKGYVTNESGTILSEEASFTNVPVFTGTGTWETAARWNVQEVPGANGDVTYGSVEDSPVIDGNCTLTASNTVTDLTINASRKLTINPEAKMMVEGRLTNNAGTSGLLVKASSTLANGSLVWITGENIQASVEMYSKAYWNLSNPTGSKYAWQYFGIPVTSLSHSPSFNNAYVRAWDESVSDYNNIWVRKNDGTSLMLSSESVLQPGLAYELVQSSNKTYTFSGVLNHSNYSKALNYTPSAYYKGQNLLSNPYTAAMDVASITFGDNTEQVVYLYNTGTYNEWLNSNGETTPGTGPGTYVPIPSGFAGEHGIPSEIPSMQGFVVKSTAEGGSVAYDYQTLVANTVPQRAKSQSLRSSTRIDLIGTRFNDRMWIFFDDNLTAGFDNGYDGRKFLGYDTQSQLYGIGSDGVYQVLAVDELESAKIGFKPGSDTEFKFVFNHQNMDLKYSKLYLIDTELNTVTDITESGTTYNFTATANTSENRFRIGGPLTATESVAGNDGITVVGSANSITILCRDAVENAQVSVYDISGRAVWNGTMNSTSATVATGLIRGSYVVRVVVGETITTRLVTI